MPTTVPTAPLTNGDIPLIGFGTFRLQGEEGRKAVADALEVGYRHIDTAAGYGNHDAVAAGVKDSGLAREDLFITTKIGHEQLRPGDVLAGCDRALQELQTDYIDLYLIHWPNPQIPLAETLPAFRTLLDDGRIRNFGVSNFTEERLQAALDLDVLPICTNQVEYHPYLNDKDLNAFCTARDVVLTAYSPLALGKVREDALLKAIGDRHGKTASQVTLRWLLQRGIVSIPKATSPEHMRENFEIFDFALTPEEYERVDSIDRWERVVYGQMAEMAGLKK
jgi:diketogulonate reductase-like aldo/keto reductase